jgi:hypothetical protein
MAHLPTSEILELYSGLEGNSQVIFGVITLGAELSKAYYGNFNSDNLQATKSTPIAQCSLMVMPRRVLPVRGICEAVSHGQMFFYSWLTPSESV